MWQEAKANDKRVKNGIKKNFIIKVVNEKQIKDLMANHKRRAERRRAYHESRVNIFIYCVSLSLIAFLVGRSTTITTCYWIFFEALSRCGTILLS